MGVTPMSSVNVKQQAHELIDKLPDDVKDVHAKYGLSE
jgi:hypothetical protein